jgi:dihydrodipicolinate synthase/N-acetylneuraminate lyase
MRRLVPGLSVFIPGHFMATGLKQGAHGSYSNIACLDPRRAQRWYETTLQDPESGMEIERQILKFFDEHLFPLIRTGYPNAAIDKLLAAIGGWAPIGTRLRWPYRFLDASKADELRGVAHDTMEGFFAL